MRGALLVLIALAGLAVLGYWALPSAEAPPAKPDSAPIAAAPRTQIGPGFRPREQPDRKPIDPTPQQGSVSQIFDPTEGETIEPQRLKEHQLSGERQIAPDPSTRNEILDSGRRVLYPVFKVCVDTTGKVARVEVIVSTGFETYDQDIAATIESWRYKPFTNTDGATTDVCSSLVLAQVIH